MGTPSEQPYDVVIVGARPAGAATAMLLARAGLRVQVVDRSWYGADTVSTHALLRGGVVQLARWGLLHRIAAAGTPPVRHCRLHYGEDRIDVPIKPGSGFDALFAPRRTVLDPILVDAARAAGAQVHFGVTINAVRHDHSGRVTGVAGVGEGGTAFATEARITVGADGIGSTVARLVDAPMERTGASATTIAYGYWDGLPLHDYTLFYRPGVAAGCFPTNGGQTCVFAATEPRRFRSLVRVGGVASAYARLLGEAAPAVLDPSDGSRAPERVRMFASRPGFLRRAYGPGWALVGDAGYFKDPITSHGLTDALRDAELLARAIVSAVTAGTQETVALANYQATRDRLSEPLFATTDAIASFAWDLDQIPRLLLELSHAMGDEVELLTQLDQSTRGATSAPMLARGQQSV
jgi:2-polyprenyl-6-methoxyphenol hydroxylase-like FAD-dependent oxidoreductase